MTTSTRLLSMLVDIACAHPSPRLLEKSGIDLMDYFPPVRFIRMMKAVHGFDEEDGRDLGAAIAANDYAKAEEVVLRKCPVRYPSSHEVYADWKAQLAAFESQDQTVSLRVTSCDRRLEQPEHAATKTLESLLLGKARGLPIYCHTDSDFLHLYLAWRHLPGSNKERRLIADMLRTERDMRLAELATDGEAFHCPLAEIRRCEVAESRCRDGMKDLDLLPTSERCSVRRALKEAGWLLQGKTDDREKLD